MKQEIDKLVALATYARDYVKKNGIQPFDKFMVFANDLTAYCTDDYSFFNLTYNANVKVIVHTMYPDGKDHTSITFNGDATAEDLQAIYDRAFSTIFEYEKNSAEVLEKQKLAQIAELESKLSKLRDL